MDTFERLTDIFRAVFGDEAIEIKDETTASDLEAWDSIAHISLIFAVEEEFGIKFTTSDLSGLGSVGDLRRVIDKRRGLA